MSRNFGLKNSERELGMNTLKNVTPLQWLGILLVINGAMIGSTAQLTDLFGPHAVKIIVAVCSLGNSICGGVITFLSGQGSMVKNVLAMDGVQHIDVNANANPTLAAIAVDPTDPSTNQKPCEPSGQV